MVCYFSGTGNSLAAAEKIAAALNERVVPIADCLKNGVFPCPGPGEKFGLVFPCYFSGLPLIVTDFIGRLDPSALAGHYIYAVITNGGAPAGSPARVCELFARRCMQMSAAFAVVMPDNFVLLYRAPSAAAAEKRLAAADKKLDEIIKAITHETVQPHPTAGEKLLDLPDRAFEAYYRSHRSAGAFSVTSACTGCGLCARNCPKDVIHVEDGRPVWSGDCVRCLSCINRCPVNAVRCGPFSAFTGRYVNPRLRGKGGEGSPQ